MSLVMLRVVKTSGLYEICFQVYVYWLWMVIARLTSASSPMWEARKVTARRAAVQQRTSRPASPASSVPVVTVPPYSDLPSVITDR